MKNRLANETSPYLQQHADNPVDWYPWGEDALRRAAAEDKPILLSIGYSACHWCHVMAHESFEDPDVAAEMNRHFVNVKVDREERPDLDQIYQTAHQMLTQRGGGWPLTVFLTPQGVPFFAGTYFPKEARYGMPGFKSLLGKVAAAYREQRTAIVEQNQALIAALERTTPRSTATHVQLERGPIDTAVRELAAVFDDVHGGIGTQPKFPHPFELQFCLRRHALDASDLAGRIVTLTLTKMAEGGIYDHLGGGFCRYSVDRYWSIPHFEKMLYDNGPLLALYADAWRHMRQPLFERVVRETAAWLMREMQSPEGGYYSSLDADSEGEEGRFYVWDREEVERLLSAEEYRAAAPHFGLDAAPNFEGRHWHLRIGHVKDGTVRPAGVPSDQHEHLIESARAKLLQARERRVRPGRDEKVLTSWNALAIKGMARAARVFARADWLDSARRAMDFLCRTVWHDGRLLATYKDGRAHLNAYLDDHAFLIDALLELMETAFEPRDLVLARRLADTLLERFEDRECGGFFFVSHDHETLILRPKSGHDNATPSGNGVAALALQRLGHLVGETRYLDAAERTLKLFYPQLGRGASGYASLLTALDEALEPPRIVIARGDEAALRAFHAHNAQIYRPDVLVLCVPNGTPDVPAALAKPEPDCFAAWICRGMTCLPPVTDATEVERLLDARGVFA